MSTNTPVIFNHFYLINKYTGASITAINFIHTATVALTLQRKCSLTLYLLLTYHSELYLMNMIDSLSTLHTINSNYISDMKNTFPYEDLSVIERACPVPPSLLAPRHPNLQRWTGNKVVLARHSR